MNIEAVRLACFSPTGTCRAVVQSIGKGTGRKAADLIDATAPDSRRKSMKLSGKDLLILAVPVYKGRVPEVLHEWLGRMELDATPVACVVVYGNREYEDALVELYDLVKKQGGIPVACAAFIGEHSYSADDTPIAVSRPDAEDLRLAEAFGKEVLEAVNALSAVSEASPINVPGNRPYHEPGGGAPVDFIAVSEKCTGCGFCGTICPAEAITVVESSRTISENCIRCCACIKACPEKARTMKEGPLKDVARRLSQMCSEQKEPAFFF